MTAEPRWYFNQYIEETETTQLRKKKTIKVSGKTQTSDQALKTSQHRMELQV